MKSEQQKGVSIIGIVIVIALIVLYFGIDIQSVVEKPQTQKNVAYVSEKTQTVWQKYLEQPAFYIWNNIFLDLIWGAFTQNLQAIKEGVPTDIQKNAPILMQSIAEPIPSMAPQKQIQKSIPQDNY